MNEVTALVFSTVSAILALVFLGVLVTTWNTKSAGVTVKVFLAFLLTSVNLLRGPNSYWLAILWAVVFTLNLLLLWVTISKRSPM